MKTMKRAVKWLDENLEETLLLILLAFMSLTMMGQIILRYLFKSPLSWVEEFCRYCFVYSGAISAGYCVRKRLGIRVDLITNALPKVFQIILEYISKIMVICLYAFLAYNSISLIATTTTVSAAMELPIKFVYAALPFGFSLGVLRGLQMLIYYTKDIMRGEA